MNKFYGWNTTKTANGYRWDVTENFSRTTPNADGRYVDTTIKASGNAATRAQAMGAAKRHVLFYRAA